MICLWLQPQTVMVLMVVGYQQGQPQPLLLWQRRLLPPSGKQVHKRPSHKYTLDQSLLVPPPRSGNICCCTVAWLQGWPCHPAHCTQCNLHGLSMTMCSQCAAVTLPCSLC